MAFLEGVMSWLKAATESRLQPPIKIIGRFFICSS